MLNAAETILQVCLSLTQGLNFRPCQGNTGFVRFMYKIIMTGLAVFRNIFYPARSFCQRVVPLLSARLAAFAGFLLLCLAAALLYSAVFLVFLSLFIFLAWFMTGIIHPVPFRRFLTAMMSLFHTGRHALLQIFQ